LKTLLNLPRTANIATRLGREEPLRRCIESLHDQLDEIRIYFNDFQPYDWLQNYPRVTAIRGKDLGASARYTFLDPSRREYYFTCDDDLIYPPDYVERTVAALQKYGGIVTYHARKLTGTPKRYYGGGHQVFMCLRNVDRDVEVDIPGSGVSCFVSSRFARPVGDHQYRNMDDIVNGLLAAKQGVRIMCLSHKEGWLQMSPEGQDDGIWATCHRNETHQADLAAQVYRDRKAPDVAVIIPYDRDRGWLDEAIRSVENQHYRGHIELILSESPANVSTNINRAVSIAESSIITYLSEDDILPQGAIEGKVEAIWGHDFSHGGATNWYTDGRMEAHRTQHPVSMAAMLNSNQIHGGSLAYRKYIFDEIGGFDDTLTSAEEYEFNLRCLDAGYSLGFNPQSLYIYRRHDAQKSLGKGVDQKRRAKVRREVVSRYQPKQPARTR